MSPNVLTDVTDGVLIITINRPEKRNAIDKATAEDIGGRDRPTRFRGRPAGGRYSRAPARASAPGWTCRHSPGGERPITGERGFAGMCTVPPQKPIIAAVEGHALGGGCELAMACDVVVAASDVKFGLPEVRRGLVAAAGGLVRLPRKIPQQIAMEMILTGRPIDAERAAALGLINRVTEPGAALAGALEIAAEIAANAPLAVRASKDIVTRSADWDLVEAFTLQRSTVQSVMTSDDAREGARAFAEKRDPVWQGQ